MANKQGEDQITEQARKDAVAQPIEPEMVPVSRTVRLDRIDGGDEEVLCKALREELARLRREAPQFNEDDRIIHLIAKAVLGTT